MSETGRHGSDANVAMRTGTSVINPPQPPPASLLPQQQQHPQHHQHPHSERPMGKVFATTHASHHFRPQQGSHHAPRSPASAASLTVPRHHQHSSHSQHHHHHQQQQHQYQAVFGDDLPYSQRHQQVPGYDNNAPLSQHHHYQPSTAGEHRDTVRLPPIAWQAPSRSAVRSGHDLSTSTARIHALREAAAEPRTQNVGRLVGDALDDVLYYQQQLDDKNVTIMKLERSLDQLQQREHLFNRAMEASARKDAHIEDMQSTIHQLNQQLQETTSSNSKLQAERDHFASTYSTATAESQQRGQELQALRPQVAEQQEQISALKSDSEAARTALAAAEEARKQIEEQHAADLAARAEQTQREVADLQQQIAEKNEAAAVLTSEREEQARQVAGLTQRLQQMKESGQSSAAADATKLQQLQEKVTQLQAEAAASSDALAQFVHQLASVMNAKTTSTDALLVHVRELCEDKASAEESACVHAQTASHHTATAQQGQRELSSVGSMLQSVLKQSDSAHGTTETIKATATAAAAAAAATPSAHHVQMGLAPVLSHVRGLGQQYTAAAAAVPKGSRAVPDVEEQQQKDEGAENQQSQQRQQPVQHGHITAIDRLMLSACVVVEQTLAGMQAVLLAAQERHARDMGSTEQQHAEVREALESRLQQLQDECTALEKDRAATKQQLTAMASSLQSIGTAGLLGVDTSSRCSPGSTPGTGTAVGDNEGEEAAAISEDHSGAAASVQRIISDIRARHKAEVEQVHARLEASEANATTAQQQHSREQRAWEEERERLMSQHATALREAQETKERLEYNIQAKEAEVEGLQQRCAHLTEQLDVARQELSQAQQQQQASSNEVAAKDQDLQNRASVIESLQDELSLRKATIQDLRGKTVQLQRQLNTAQTTFDEEKSRMAAAIVHLKQKKQEHEQKIASLQTLVDEQGTLKNLNEQQRRVLHLEAELASTKAKMSDVKATMHSDLVKEVQTLQADLRDAKGVIAAVQMERDAAKQDNAIELSVLKSTVSRLEKELESVRTEYDAIKAQDFESVIRKREERQKELENALELKQSEVDEQKHFVKIAEERIQRLEEAAARNDRERELQATITDLRRVISELKAAAEEDAEALRKLRANQMERDAAVREHKERIEALETERQQQHVLQAELVEGFAAWANDIGRAAVGPTFDPLQADVWKDEHEQLDQKREKWQRRLNRVSLGVRTAVKKRDEQIAEIPALVKDTEERVKVHLQRQEQTHEATLLAMKQKMERQNGLLAEFDKTVARVKELEGNLAELEGSLAAAKQETEETHLQLQHVQTAERAARDEMEQLKSTNQVLEERSKHSLVERLSQQQVLSEASKNTTTQRIKELEAQLHASKVDAMRRLRSKSLLITSLKRELQDAKAQGGAESSESGRTGNDSKALTPHPPPSKASTSPIDTAMVSKEGDVLQRGAEVINEIHSALEASP